MCRHHLNSISNLTYVISNIFLSSPFKRNFGAYNANKNADFILRLVNFVTVPTER